MPIDEVLSPRRWAGFDLSRPLVMGILNVTPDSFSDGGRFAVAEAAIAAGRAMREAGADIVDIGGESTRPGAEAVTSEEESARVVPVIRALAEDGIAISIDTRNAATMAAALDAGARIVNDISGLRHDPRAASLVAARGCPVVLMHMRGTPATMGCHAHYADLVREVIDELAQRRDAALQAGIAPEAIALDPGFGFAKQGKQNVVLFRSLGRFQALGHPLLVGVSRKRFIGALAGEADPARRDAGSIAAALFAANRGAAILRVHDVAGTAQALLMWRALGDEARHFE
ncbi:dihydropteroate synthase [Acidiphilium sp. AL]|uniref:dihydropteroate synthase n=1 Tax=Acidiphilium sp. AL TaxID=2871704 RepID=UPI0021CB3EEF|nr:dihydropteroate synthase [Acidiphilium sp. AL]MCU4159542.1 dihydropteroate synthase [Acidiphilium sp. AL]